MLEYDTQLLEEQIEGRRSAEDSYGDTETKSVGLREQVSFTFMFSVETSVESAANGMREGGKERKGKERKGKEGGRKGKGREGKGRWMGGWMGGWMQSKLQL